MRRTLIALALFGFAAATQAVPVVFVGSLSGGAEVPPNASTASGDVTISFDQVANTLHVMASYTGLIGGGPEAAHIHCCIAPGSNVGVATTTPSFPDFPTTTSGSYDRIFDTTLASTYNAAFLNGPGGATIQGAEDALFAGMLAGNSYFNIHNAQFPGGEIRANVTLIPEPSTYVLLGAGLLVMAGIARRSRA